MTYTDQNISVIELRNYILKPGKRDSFINYFEENFIQSQIELGGYPVGQFRVTGMDDNFFWIRGFADMDSRSKFLPAFYYGPVWKQYGAVANSMLLNNDNVYLLKPLTWNGGLQHGKSITIDQLKARRGIVVIDFYIANTKLNKLIAFFSETYISILEKAGIENYTLWTSELAENDFPRLPVFQDKNLLAAITFYKDESEYVSKQKFADAALRDELKAQFGDIVTTQNTLILYPTERSYL